MNSVIRDAASGSSQLSGPTLRSFRAGSRFGYFVSSSTCDPGAQLLEHALNGKPSSAEADKKGKHSTEPEAETSEYNPTPPSVAIKKVVVLKSGDALVEFVAEACQQSEEGNADSTATEFARGLRGDLPTGAKLLAAVGEGRLYKLALPNPWPAVVGEAAESSATIEVNKGTFGYEACVVACGVLG